MKKALVCCVALLLFAGLLGGCMKPDKPIDSSPPNSVAISSPMASPSATPNYSPNPSKSAIQPSTDIPEIILNPDEYMVDSNNENLTRMYEDSDNIYTMFQEEDSCSLLATSKASGKTTILLDNCFDFVFHDGCIYWIKYEIINDEGNGKYDTVYKYDIKENKNTLIRKFNKSVYSLCIKDDRIYLMYERYTEAESKKNGIDWYSDLYSMNMDGTNLKKIKEDVNEVGIYKDKYYCTENGEEGAPIYEYNPSTGKSRDITEDDALEFHFAIAYGKLFYDGARSHLKMVDLDSSDEREFTDAVEDEFAVLGQYLVYIAADSPRLLMVYDITNAKTYKLVESPGYIVPRSLQATQSAIYIKCSGVLEQILYKLVIEGGKGKLVAVTK